jgi:cell division protein FtsL
MTGQTVMPVQGMYTAVAPAPGTRRAHGAWMGTPEIYFAKSIDNTRLVKITDRKRTKEMAQFTISLCALFLLVMVYAFQHFSAIEYGYKIEAQKKQKEELNEANRALRLEEASLRDPERIDVLARQMGLNSPEAGQVIRLDRAADQRSGAVAMMSQVRVSDVAVIAAQ